jgi:MFS family permease
MQKQIIALIFGIFLSTTSFFIVVPLIPLMVSQFKDQQNAEVWSGAVLGVSFFVSALATPIWGTLASKYGARLILMRAAFGLFITYLLTPFAQTYPQLFALRCVNGLMAGFVPAALGLITAASNQERLGKTLSVVSMAQAVGSLCGPAAGGMIAAYFGLKSTIIFASASMFLAGLLIVFFVSDLDVPTKNTVQDVKPSPPHHGMNPMACKGVSIGNPAHLRELSFPGVVARRFSVL